MNMFIRSDVTLGLDEFFLRKFFSRHFCFSKISRKFQEIMNVFTENSFSQKIGIVPIKFSKKNSKKNAGSARKVHFVHFLHFFYIVFSKKIKVEWLPIYPPVN